MFSNVVADSRLGKSYGLGRVEFLPELPSVAGRVVSH